MENENAFVSSIKVLVLLTTDLFKDLISFQNAEMLNATTKESRNLQRNICHAKIYT